MAARFAPALTELLALPDFERKLGPFQLVQQLGRGGFAPVWLAREVYGDTVLRTAAVKLFVLGDGATRLGPAATPSGSGARGPGIVEEARLLCQVEHPNIVRFYSLPTDERRGVVGLAMEHVAGTSLDARLHAEKRLSVEETLAAGVAVASALSAVHRAALVHRDVKPANIVDAGGIYKLIDFGIAAAETPARRVARERPERFVMDDLPFDAAGSNLSQLVAEGAASGSAEVTSGTVGYIDPVCVVTGDRAVPASDLYSLGATLFECLSGTLPAVAAAGAGGGFRGEVLDGRAPAPRLRTVAPSVPPALAAVVDALLSPERDARPASAEWVALELDRVRRELAGRARALPPESVGPFRGLARFEAADRDVYFGRTAEVAAALELLRARGLVALIGPSGSGKSSLARAGVAPAVADGALGGAVATWDTVVVAPGADPRGALIAALAPLLDIEPATLASDAPEQVVQALTERAQTQRRGLLLLVDQLEELTTMAAPEHTDGREWACRLLAVLAERPLPGVRALVTVRRDLLDSLLALPRVGAAVVGGSLLVTSLTDAAWGEVLDQALDAYGYALEDASLRDELLAELHGTASAMPLVQFALSQLWNHRDAERKIIPRSAVRALGGVAGALELHAEGVVRSLSRARPAAEDVVRDVLLALTTPDGTRRTLAERELEKTVFSPFAPQVLASLERARLVVREAQGLTLAHDALLVQWGRLRSWVAEGRDDRMLAEELEHDAARWKRSPESTAPWRRGRLAAAEAVAARGAVVLSRDALELVRAGRSAEGRVRWMTGAALLGIGAAVALAGSLWVSAVQTEEQRTQRALEAAEKNLELAKKNERDALAEKARVDALLAQLDEATRRALLSSVERSRSSPDAGARPVFATQAAEPPAEPFDRTAALRAFGVASNAVQSCREPGGPVGAGRVAVTFAPDGSATGATLEGPPFAGTSVGACVVARFKKARVPPFSGSPPSMDPGFPLYPDDAALLKDKMREIVGAGDAGAPRAQPGIPSGPSEPEWDRDPR